MEYEKPLLYVGLGFAVALYLMSKISFIRPTTASMNSVKNIENINYDNYMQNNHSIELVRRI